MSFFVVRPMKGSLTKLCDANEALALMHDENIVLTSTTV